MAILHAEFLKNPVIHFATGMPRNTTTVDVPSSPPRQKSTRPDGESNNKFMKFHARGNMRDKANIIRHSLPLSIYSAVGFASESDERIKTHLAFCKYFAIDFPATESVENRRDSLARLARPRDCDPRVESLLGNN